MNEAVCGICPHNCRITEGKTGFCGARRNRDGVIIDENYGLVTSLALDPIEKKPLRRFYPGSMILSVGSYGCNFRCPFCQNYEISMACEKDANGIFVSPEALVQKALELVVRGNIGIAFTYNEPLIGYEYVMDCARLSHKNGLKNVVVTNGFINEGPLAALLPYVDAMNIDLKSFSEDFYDEIGGKLSDVKKAIAMAARACHVEVTTLVIPGKNDSPDEMRMLSAWLASVDPKIPLHISRFFPLYKMTDRDATPVSTVCALAQIARESLSCVYVGNC